jgi:hypothetical protein
VSSVAATTLANTMAAARKRGCRITASYQDALSKECRVSSLSINELPLRCFSTKLGQTWHAFTRRAVRMTSAYH